MKTAVIFMSVVLIAFLAIYLLFNQKPQTQTATNFLTPTPTPTVSVAIPTPGPTVDVSDRISAKMATIKTAKGNIELELYPDIAPKTVTNFATHAKKGYYDNLTFHRVEEWVIQGGDPSGNGTGGESIYGPTFEDEITPTSDLYKAGYVRGTLAMANRGPNTNGSQFFIIKKDTPLNPAYTIFGKVTSGMDVVDQIAVGDKITGIDVQ
ncbi:MAG TPA: peptidylprolyl isomerase [Patescibacteria group bacterium]|nr:peptidylprolyl isomerase [Patescibacteria group bacterium]